MGPGLVVSRFSCAAGKQGLTEKSRYNLQRGADSSFLDSAEGRRPSPSSSPSAKTLACRRNQSVWLPGDIRASGEIKLPLGWKKN